VLTDLICEAIACKRLLQFIYQNHERVVEPHLLGRASSGHDIVSGYFVRGYSESQQEPGWRFYKLNDVTLLSMLDERFPGPREGYDPKDPRMQKVYCCLERE
jgi:hypothetical protein